MTASATSGRFVARRVSARRWSRLRVVVVLGLLLALVGAAGWVMLGSPLLSVRSVQVAGASRVTPAEVLAVADVAPATPLARVDTDAVARRVGALVAVRSVSGLARIHLLPSHSMPSRVSIQMASGWSLSWASVIVDGMPADSACASCALTSS